MERLPYAEMLAVAEAAGTVLHREDIYGSGPPVDAVSEEILAYVAANVGHRVLDVGCGVGPYVHRLGGMGHECVGVDLNRSAVRWAQTMGRDVRCVSAYDLPFPDRSFDSVILVECLEHLDDVTKALSEAARVADHSVVVTVPDVGALSLLSKVQVVPWHILESSHINFFTPEILRKQLLQHFPSCEATRLGHFFNVGEEPVYMHAAAVARR